MTRLAQMAVAAVLLCPMDLDAGVAEAGVPPPTPAAVYADAEQAARDINAIIDRIKEAYGVNK